MKATTEIKNNKFRRRVLPSIDDQPATTQDGLMLDVIDMTPIPGNSDGVMRAIKKLTYRERVVVVALYGLGGIGNYSLRDVGKVFNVTRERVRQIKIKAILKLRDILNEK